MTSLLLLLLAVQDPGPVLDRASASFDTVRTLQADFVQIIDNPMLGDPDTTRGKLFQLRAGNPGLGKSGGNRCRELAERRIHRIDPRLDPREQLHELLGVLVRAVVRNGEVSVGRAHIGTVRGKVASERRCMVPDIACASTSWPPLCE